MSNSNANSSGGIKEGPPANASAASVSPKSLLSSSPVSSDFSSSSSSSSSPPSEAPPRPVMSMEQAMELARRVLVGDEFASKMDLNRKKVTAAIDKWKRHDADVGSPEVQIALLTERIRYLTEHFKGHKKDKHSMRGLQQLLSKRRSNLLYLERRNPRLHASIMQELGIRMGGGKERMSQFAVRRVFEAENEPNKTN